MGKEIKKCTIISGAPDYSVDFLISSIDCNSFIIAADSGYKKLLSANIKPDMIIGDFDSSPKPDVECDILTLPCQKDDTDTFYCVKKAVELGFNDITIMFAVGNRFDHTYSNILCLDYCYKLNVNCVIIDNHNKISLIDNEHTFSKEYSYFSLFAFLDDCKGVSIKGSHYDVCNIDIATHNQFAQSNQIKDDFCTVTVKQGRLLLVESND